jgi:hypothetical protein
MYINVPDGHERHTMTFIATLKTVGSEIAETLKDTLFDSDSCDTSMSARLERERENHFEVLRRRGAFTLR